MAAMAGSSVSVRYAAGDCEQVRSGLMTAVAMAAWAADRVARPVRPSAAARHR